MTSPTYALVVDDHPLSAEGARQILLTLPTIDRVLLSASGDQALTTMASEGSPAITIVDFWLEEGGSTPFIRDMLALSPTTKILMTSGDKHPAISDKARTAGAHGFIAKSRPASEFLAAVKTLLSGAQWFDDVDPQWAAVYEGTTALRLSAKELGITPRQSQVLSLVLHGKPNRAIAQALNVSEHTVKEHVTALLQRMGVSNRVELITSLRGVELDL